MINPRSLFSDMMLSGNKLLAFLLIIMLPMLALGAAGYMFIEGWSLVDSLYMVVITMTTIGYGEVHELSKVGQVYTMIVGTTSFIFSSAFVGLITYTLVETRFDRLLRRRRMENRMKHLKNHNIICGAGRVGRQIMQEFMKTKVPFIVVDNKKNVLSELLEEYPGIFVIEGDATDNDVLEKANIREAKGLLSALNTDSENLFVCISARDINPKLHIVTRATEINSIHKLEKAGADHVISPIMIGALRMASIVLRPDVVSFLDVMIRDHDLNLRMEQAEIPEKSTLVGKTLAEAQIPKMTGLMVISVKHVDDEGYIFNPTSTYTIREGDIFVILGTPEQRKKLIDYAA